MPHRSDPSRQLSSALSDGDVQEICRLVGQFPSLVNARDQAHGLQTPLMRICHIRNVDRADRDVILNLMRMKEPEADVRDGSGRTALCHACISEKTDVIEFLASLGGTEGDPNLADEDGNTPLMYATKSRKVAVVQALVTGFLDSGLDIDAVNNKGVSALKEAENRCDSEICRILIDAGADVSVLDHIKFPRDVRIPSTPRTPTPDHILGRSPKVARKRLRAHAPVKPEATVLTPLVVPARSRGPQPGLGRPPPLVQGRPVLPPTPRGGGEPRGYMGETRGYMGETRGYMGETRGYMGETVAPSDLEASRDPPRVDDDDDEGDEEEGDVSSLPSVAEADEEDEEDEEDEVDEGMSEGSGEGGESPPRRRKNSFSLPDLREGGGMVGCSSSSTSYDEGFHSSTKSGRRSTQFTLDELPLARVSEQEEYDYRSVPSGGAKSSRLTQRRPSASLPDLRESGPVCLVSNTTTTTTTTTRKPRHHRGARAPPLRVCSDVEDDVFEASTDSDSDDHVEVLRGRDARLTQSHGNANNGTLRLPQLNIHAQLTSSLPALPKSLRTGFTGVRRPSITSLLPPGGEERRKSVTLNRENTELVLELRGSKVQ